ncbi:uncharacterized protein [Ptychodera flava]|uniref:uncharacterized protein n=1 Tax=Ptychodera flava TaxID=63121 RepID=UPI00396A6763
MAKNKDLREILEMKVQEWRSLLKKQDFSGLEKMYTTDAKIMGPGQRTIMGHKEIVKLLEGGSREEEYPSEYTVEDTFGKYGDQYVTSLGCFSMPKGGSGKDIMVWKYVDGDYLIQADAWNKDQ